MSEGALPGSDAVNCIVDDSALLAGLNDSSSLRKWVHDGHVNVFVPLYTLGKLNQMRSSPPPTNLQVRKALDWLDEITTATEKKVCGRVELQGPDDQYSTWSEVEKYLLPETPLSSTSGIDGLHGMSQGLTTLKIDEGDKHDVSNQRRPRSGFAQSIEMPYSSTDSTKSVPSGSDRTSVNELNQNPSAFAATSSSPESDAGNYPDAFAPTVEDIPSSLRPLLNFVVWRTYHRDSSIRGTGKYILLTNDPMTQKLAQKFGVRAKLVAQLRTVFKRDGNKHAGTGTKQRDNAKGTPVRNPLEATDNLDVEQEDGEGDDEDEIIFNPAQRPGSSRGAKQSPDVWDPDHFGRTPHCPSHVTTKESYKTNEMSNGKGAQNGPYGRASPRGGVTRGRRASRSTGLRGRGTYGRGQATQTYPQTIDPDSYARPPPNSKRGGRGAARRLFDPNT